MLDFAHRLTLRAVARGKHDGEETPAVANLLAARLLARDDDGRLVVTDAGRAALAASGG